MKFYRICMIAPIPPPVGGISKFIEFFCENKPDNLDIRIVNVSKMAGLNQFKRTLRVLIKLLKEILWGKNDIFYLSTNMGKYGIYRDFLCLALLKILKRKVITHYHCDVSVYRKKLSRHGEIAFKYLIRNSDMNLVLNEQSKEEIRNDNIKNKVKKIFNPIKILKNKKNNYEKRESIIFVGRVVEDKGIELIYDIAKSLKNIDFKIIGPVEEVVKEKYGNVNIEYMGEKSTMEVRENIYNSDIFLFPSKAEGFSVAVLEAMECGIPIIASNVGAINEMIDQEFIMKKYAKEEYITCINKIYSKKKELENIGKRNRAKAEKEFNIIEFNNIFLSVLEEVKIR
ncbi:MAG: glycosyltransferase family 4 protein [Sarcina sp.]